jgi:hypothetical protein
LIGFTSRSIFKLRLAVHGVHVHECQDLCSTAEVWCTPAGQTALLWWGSTAALPLLVGHSQISGPLGQRSVYSRPWHIDGVTVGSSHYYYLPSQNRSL